MHTIRLILLTVLLLSVAGCGSSTVPSIERTTPPVVEPAGADLSVFDTTRVEIDQVEFEVWLAETLLQHQLGLMEATEAQIAPLGDGTPRGMLFLFGAPQTLTFWMKDTYVPLDLAFIRDDGVIAEIHELTPLDLSIVSSSEAVHYALEVPAGTFDALGIAVGSVLDLPIP